MAVWQDVYWSALGGSHGGLLKQHGMPKSTVAPAQVDGVLASIILDDFFVVGESMLKGAPEVQKLCADFGIPSMDHVAIDTWPSKHAAPC